MTDLGALSRYAGLSVGRAINRHGEVVGSADTAGGIHHATIFHRGGMAGLFPIPTAQFLGVAYGINDEGTVVGAADSAGGVPRGFVLDRTSRVLTTLGSLPERPASEAYAINAGGLVVGRAFRPGDDTSLESERAMLWRDDTGVALDHLLTDGAGWTLTAAHSVNDAGQIAGVGTRTGRHRAILLTPAALTAPVPVLGCRRCA
jgi:probable HAF family extracellular repeat protein